MTGQHWVAIEHLPDGDIDWTVEHPLDCPTETIPAPDGHVDIEFHTCGVGTCVEANGLDDIQGWRDLDEGRHAIRFVHRRYPATHDSPEEHDIWIELGMEGEDDL